MLVLALQFSKGGRRGRTSDMFVERGTPRAAGASSVPSPRVTTLLGRLPQNGREDKVSSSRRAKRNESYD
jgi:hypothetical protein